MLSDFLHDGFDEAIMSNFSLDDDDEFYYDDDDDDDDDDYVDPMDMFHEYRNRHRIGGPRWPAEHSEEDELILESMRIAPSIFPENEAVLDEILWEALPLDLQEKVLTWLPPAAHFRLRSVCKRWNTLASSPGWLRSYADMKSRPSCTIMWPDGAREARFFCHTERKWFDVPLHPASATVKHVHWELVSADAGLVCYQGNRLGDLFVCVHNPLQQSSRVVAPNYPHHDIKPSHCEILRLLVNRSTYAFKVVVLVHSTNPSTTVVYDSTTAEWKVFKSFPSQKFRAESNFVWKNMIYLQCLSISKLLAFNVDSGVWSEVNTQLPCQLKWRHFIVNNNDRILLVQTSATVVADPFEVWVLRTDSASPTLNFSRARWVKLLVSMPRAKCLLRDVRQCFSQTDRICFTASYSNNWFSYTFATKSWHIMPTTEERRNHGFNFFEWEPRLDMDVEMNSSAPIV